jgi:hypothetical protein
MALLSCPLPGFVVRVTEAPGLNLPVWPNRAAARPAMVATGPLGLSALSLRSAGYQARFPAERLDVTCE